jgi:hypothetical protein
VRLKKKGFDNNKLYASEILSILLQNLNSFNQRIICSIEINENNTNIDGLEFLMQIINMQKKIDTVSQDEQVGAFMLFD